MTDLFDADPIHAPGARRAPDALNPAQLRHVEDWAEAHCPWISRGALDSLTPVEEYVDACLTHFRAGKTLRVDWAATVIAWIRKDERGDRGRVTRLARAGSESARLALRDPKRWAAEYDRKARLVAAAAPPAELIAPVDSGARVVSLAARRSE